MMRNFKLHGTITKFTAAVLSVGIILPTAVASAAVAESGTCVKIEAEYNADNSLKSVVITENIPVEGLTAPENTDTKKTFYWESIGSMKPVEIAGTPSPGDLEGEASITIKYVDEEKNKIKDDATYSEEYKSGDTYSVPDEYKKNFVVKTEGGMYNHYTFNSSTSDIPTAYSENMTVTLVFNNDVQYDYYEDFENYTLDTSKWHEQAASVPDPTVETDHTKYIYHKTGDSTTGGYMTFDEVDTTGKRVHITADVKFTEPTGSSKGNSQITICNTSPTFSGNNITWGINDTSAGHIIALEYNGGRTFKVNNVTADTGFIGDWVHMEADADFGSKEVSVTLTNGDGKSATYDSTIYSKTFDKNIGAFYMRSAGAAASTGIDNITVRITGNGGEVVPDVESVINFKSVYAFGDSIVYGHNAPKQSFMSLIAADYAMDLNMMAKNGATIMPSSNRVLTQINNAPVAEPDIVVFEGYTNDAYGSAESDSFNSDGSHTDIATRYGEITPAGTTAFDENTFCGSFEKTISAIKTKWPSSKVVFITIHKSGARNFDIQTKLHDLTVAMCEKWDVEVVDMFKDSTLDTRDSTQMAKYIINGSGSHPNVAACREFYIPAIVGKLESLYAGETPAPISSSAPDNPTPISSSAPDNPTPSPSAAPDNPTPSPSAAPDNPTPSPSAAPNNPTPSPSAVPDNPTPSPSAEPDDLTEDETEPTAAKTYKFDFIADGETADTDAYPVTKTSEYNSTIAEDGVQYGLYGANVNDYKLNNYVDGVTTTKGQLSVYLDGEDCIGPYKVTGGEAAGDDGYGQIAGLYPIRFSMAGKNGGYYRVKVTLKGLDKTKAADATLYSERRHPIIMNETIPAGESKEVEFTATLQNVAIKNRTSGGTDTYKDDKVNVVAVGENIAIDKIEISEIEHQPTIFMYDDSTGCDYAMILPYFNLQNYGGTGQFISKYLRKSYAVANQGDGGINATDNTHWNAAKASISAGDYVYVQYGHNHKNDGAQGYVKSLNKYYDYAHDAGAYTILAGPIDRHNSTQYDKTTNTWNSTLGSFSKAAEYFTKLMILRGPDTVATFVDKVKASSSKSIDADIYAWADGEIAKGLDGENGRDDIAFVDLNAPTLSWLSEVCDTVKTQTGASGYSASYTDYYFLSRKGTKVDGTHANDAGADNTAKFFFDGAKDIVTKKDKDAAETVMAEVLKPLVTNMRTAEPMAVSANIVTQGSAPNAAWPELYKSSNAAAYPAAIKDITWKENGTIDTVSILKQESTTYMSAYGILELIIKDKNGTVKGTINSTQIDNTWDDGTLTNFSTSEETNKLTGDTNAKYDEEAGDTFTAIVWQATDNGSGLGIYKDDDDNPVPYSEYYKLSDGSGPLLTNEDGESPENFNFYGAIYTEDKASNLNGNNGWIVNGSSAKNTTLGKDGSRYYANLEKQTKSKSFFVYKKLDSEIAATGKIGFSMDMQYISGSGMYIGVANSFNSKGSPWYNNQLTLLTVVSNSSDSTGNTANVKATDGSSNKTVGTISKDSWTTVSGTLDMDNGKMTVKVGEGTETETTISNYDTISTVITPSTLAAFFIKGADKELVGIRISNVAVTKIADTDLPNKTLTISASDPNSGNVSIEGTGEPTLTSVQNSEVTITATAKTENDKFLGWYEGETLISEEETLTLRLHRDLTLVARFKNLSSATIASAVNNAEYGSVTLNGSEDTSLNVSEDDTVTLRAISKTGYKFVNWTKDGSVVSTTPSYTITAGSSSETYTSNFAALASGETVWEFTDIADNDAVTTTTETAQKTYGGLEIHLATGGDSVSADGLYWKGPGSTKSDATPVTNNRYIKYTADAAGTLDINFSSTYMAGANNNNNPRMYIVTNEDNLSKNGGDGENTAGTGKSYTLKKSNSVETISINTAANTTYYIFPYCYGNSEAPFAISSISFTRITE